MTRTEVAAGHGSNLSELMRVRIACWPRPRLLPSTCAQGVHNGIQHTTPTQSSPNQKANLRVCTPITQASSDFTPAVVTLKPKSSAPR